MNRHWIEATGAAFSRDGTILWASGQSAPGDGLDEP